METRQITQIKLYSLFLNPMSGKWEETQIAAIGTDKEKLTDFYKEQLTEELWEDGRFRKSFKKDSPLEWFNTTDLNSRDSYGRGIQVDWINEEDISAIKNRFYFVE